MFIAAGVVVSSGGSCCVLEESVVAHCGVVVVAVDFPPTERMDKLRYIVRPISWLNLFSWLILIEREGGIVNTAILCFFNQLLLANPTNEFSSFSVSLGVRFVEGRVSNISFQSRISPIVCS